MRMGRIFPSGIISHLVWFICQQFTNTGKISAHHLKNRISQKSRHQRETSRSPSIRSPCRYHNFMPRTFPIVDEARRERSRASRTSFNGFRRLRSNSTIAWGDVVTFGRIAPNAIPCDCESSTGCGRWRIGEVPTGWIATGWADETVSWLRESFPFATVWRRQRIAHDSESGGLAWIDFSRRECEQLYQNAQREKLKKLRHHKSIHSEPLPLP